MANLILNGSTSGSITLAAPAVANTTTLTLPTTSGTVMVNGPAFSAYRNSNQTFTTGVVTKVQLNAEVFDTANCFDSSTNYRFTPTTAGYYQINAQARIRGTTSDNKILYIYKNGSNYSAMDNYSLAIEYFQIAFSQIIYLNGTTDYIEMYGYSNGTNTTFTGDATILYTSLSGAMIRSA